MCMQVYENFYCVIFCIDFKRIAPYKVYLDITLYVSELAFIDRFVHLFFIKLQFIHAI